MRSTTAAQARLDRANSPVSPHRAARYLPARLDRKASRAARVNSRASRTASTSSPTYREKKGAEARMDTMPHSSAPAAHRRPRSPFPCHVCPTSSASRARAAAKESTAGMAVRKLWAMRPLS